MHCVSLGQGTWGVVGTVWDTWGLSPRLCSHCRGLLAAPAQKPEKVRNFLEHWGCPGAKPECSLTPPTLCLDSDREDGNYCPPIKRERTSSLTHSGERQPRGPGGPREAGSHPKVELGGSLSNSVGIPTVSVTL